MSDYNIIPATELDRVVASGAFIVDVRTAMEHAQSKLKHPHDHVPLDELDADDFMLRRGLDRQDPVYILCRSGGRARQAADKFMKAGYPNIHVIDGGLTACEACGHAAAGQATAPGQKSDNVIPLERQVRIAAGALAVLGVVLGSMVAPIFYALSLFVGLGLVYAGITDRCGMALLLSKAPWNKVCATQCGVTPASGKKESACA